MNLQPGKQQVCFPRQPVVFHHRITTNKLLQNNPLKWQTAILYTLLPLLAHTQAKDSIAPKTGKPGGLEMLNAGTLDITQTLQMTAATRLLKVCIGEPGKWNIPVSLYTSVSANNMGTATRPEVFTAHLVNPFSGMLGLGLNDWVQVAGKPQNSTAIKFRYQGMIRYLPIPGEQQKKNGGVFSSIVMPGIVFTTGAWEAGKENNNGVFWLEISGYWVYAPPQTLRQLYTEQVTQNMFFYAVCSGISITRVLYCKLQWHRSINNRALKPPQIQLTVSKNL
jgi:hypothetical protein